jgi:transcriptional regulator with XRE-family HTH domain
MTGAMIRRLRIEKGLTQEQLAEAAKLSQPALSQYEKGHVTPSLPAAKRLARALGVSLDSLITEPEEVDQ